MKIKIGKVDNSCKAFYFAQFFYDDLDYSNW